MVVKQDLVLSIVREPSAPTFPPNPTVIPDSLFESLVPIFVIRNPVHVMPSLYAMSLATMGLSPTDEDFQLLTCTLTQRLLFDHFREKMNRAPVVVNGDDILWRTKEMSRGVCKALEIDPSSLNEMWEVLPEELQHPNPLIRAFTTTINTSTGIERPSGGPVSQISV